LKMRGWQPHSRQEHPQNAIAELGVELATLEDAARFMGHMRPWRQVRPHWEYAAELVLIAASTGEEADIETAQMERALRRDNWL
jgi:hypothetical protein